MNQIKALILTGGKSSRMGKDKGSLHYHGKDQISHIKEMLTPLCNDIYVSCREDQKDEYFLKGHNLLFDKYPSVSPTTGILTAQKLDTECGWLVIACDLPYLTSRVVEDLILKRNTNKLATCYLDPSSNLPEPLCAIYEPQINKILIDAFMSKKPCPRKVLINNKSEYIELKDKGALTNINTPLEMKSVGDLNEG